MAGVGITLDHLLPDSLFVNDKKVSEIQGQYATQQAQINANAAGQQAAERNKLYMTLGLIFGGVLALFGIIWAIK